MTAAPAMDTELLKTFLEVARTRHFGRAAENLFVSQSAVSARIRLLEDTVGAALFTRERNNIGLTPSGQKLVRHAERIINSWNRARQDITVQDATQTAVAVGGTPSLWDIALQDWLTWVDRTMPGTALSAETTADEVTVRRLQDGTLDLGFVFEPPQAAQLEVIELFRVPLILVATSPALTAEQALASRYVLVDWGTSFAISHARHFPDMPAPSLRAGLGRIAIGFVLAGGGAAYLARPMVESHLAGGTLFPVQDAPTIDRAAYAAFAVEAEKSAVIRQLLDYFSRLRTDRATATTPRSGCIAPESN